MEWLLLEALPIKRKLLCLGSKSVVPVLETARCLFLKVSGKLFKSLEFDEGLDAEPCGFRKPVFERDRSWCVKSLRAENEEVHLGCVVLNVKQILLHESEGE